MSGEQKIQNDDDFLDDFVIDDEVAAQPEDTEPEGDLPPDAEAAQRRAASADSAARKLGPAGSIPELDSDDMLFEDHTVGLQPTEKFAGKGEFSDAVASNWDGSSIDLAEEVEGAGIPFDDEQGTPVELGIEAESLALAEASFSEELDSLLQSEDNLTLDSEQELEIVGDDGAPVEMPVAGIADEIDVPDAMTDTFVLADGESCWEEIDEAAEPSVSLAAEEEDSSAEYFSNLSTAARGGSPGENEAGWEPLPGTNIDDLAEVDGVDLVDDDQDAAEAAPWTEDEVPEHAGVAFAAVAADVEGHDIYADQADDEPEVVGGYRPRGRLLGTFAALAASLAVIAGAALAVYRPDWFGLHYEPEQVEVVAVQRPRIVLDVRTPPMPVVATPNPTESPVPTGTGPDGTGGPVTVPPVTVPPQPTVVVAEPPPVVTAPPDNPPVSPVVVVTAPDTVPGPETAPQVPVVEVPVVEIPVVEVPVAQTPVAQLPVVEVPIETPTPIVVPVPVSGGVPWPVAVAGGPGHTPSEVPVRGKGSAGLLRVGENLLVGEAAEAPARQVAEGVMPGARAFAQLHNGNYFIGSVKVANSRFVTLRVAAGEISIARDQIAHFTELGSADYDELQKATSGFVRLTNNNRLVGAILSSIADDHIILETRSNRVMLPKSAIGEIVQTGSESDVKIDTTREEDAWLRRMSERQLDGKWQPTAVPPKRSPQSGGQGK